MAKTEQPDPKSFLSFPHAFKSSQKFALYATTLILLVVGLLWLAITQIKASSAPPTVKIGLVAPFEGLYRATGYEVLFAVKLALQERNQGEGLNGYRVELVALNDFNDPVEAQREARVLIADPDIVGVVGHLSSDSTLAAIPVYQEANLALVIPWSVESVAFRDSSHGIVSVAATYEETRARLQAVSRDMGFNRLEILTNEDVNTLPDSIQALQLSTDAVSAGNIFVALQKSNISLPLFGSVDVGNRQLVQVAGTAADGLIFVSPGPDSADLSGQETFIEAYQTLAGFPPTPRAILAYDATHILLDSIEQAIINNDKWRNSRPTRAEVSAVISTVERQGASGKIVFNSQGQRLDAPIWVYQISEARYPGTLIAP